MLVYFPKNILEVTVVKLPNTMVKFLYTKLSLNHIPYPLL